MYTPTQTFYQQPSYQASIRQPQTQIPQQPPISQTVSPFLKGRLVSSIEEARAQTIDFDGSVFYFPDLANHRIYTKQINLDGTSTLNMYELKEIPMQMPVENSDFVTRQEFEQALNPIRQIMAAAQTQNSQGQEQGSTQSESPQYKF